MASELHVDAIKHSGGTNAITINSSGSVNMPGSVIQVVTSETTTQMTGSAPASETALGFTCAITPKFSSSKIYVAVDLQTAVTGNVGNYAVAFRVRRGTSASDTLITQSRFGRYDAETNVAREMFASTALSALDSPNTTSSTTYGTFVNNLDGTPTYKVSPNSGRSTITLMEIAQ